MSNELLSLFPILFEVRFIESLMHVNPDRSPDFRDIFFPCFANKYDYMYFIFSWPYQKKAYVKI